MITSSNICSHARRSPPWTTVEVAVLRRAYTEGGVHAAYAALPHRPEGAIRAQAQRHGITAPPKKTVGGSGIKPKLKTTPEIDAMIIAAHRESVIGWKGRLSLVIGCSCAWVSARAAELGLQSTFRKEPKWTAEELAIVRDNASMHCDTISRKLAEAGYQRSMGAVKRQIGLHGFDRSDPDIWTAAELAKLMGVSCHMASRWMDVNGLKHTRGDGDVRPHRKVARADFRRWAVKNINLIDLRRVDQTWFKDVMWGKT